MVANWVLSPASKQLLKELKACREKGTHGELVGDLEPVFEIVWEQIELFSGTLGENGGKEKRNVGNFDWKFYECWFWNACEKIIWHPIPIFFETKLHSQFGFIVVILRSLGRCLVRFTQPRHASRYQYCSRQAKPAGILDDPWRALLCENIVACRLLHPMASKGYYIASSNQ